MGNKPLYKNPLILVLGIILAVFVVAFIVSISDGSKRQNIIINEYDYQVSKVSNDFNVFLNSNNISYRIAQTIDKYGNKIQTMTLNLRDSPINKLDDSSKIQFIFDSIGIPFSYLYEDDKNSDYYATKWYVSKPDQSYYNNRLGREEIIIYIYGSNIISIKNFYDGIITSGNLLGNLDRDVSIDYEYYDKKLNITISNY